MAIDTYRSDDYATIYHGSKSLDLVNRSDLPRERTVSSLSQLTIKVACMFVLLILLLLSNRFAGQRNTSKVVKWLEIPCGFCLRWLNLLFTPSFVTLPLSPRISINEVLKIAAVFSI